MSATPGQATIASTPVAVGLARASWLCSVGIFVLAGVGRQLFGKSLLVDLVSLLISIVGLALGIAALFGMRRLRRKGILAPALTGIGINGLLILIWLSNFFAAYARARAASGRS